MEKIIFFGIGSNSFETLNTSSFAVKQDNEKWILVDCGPDTPRQISKAKISFLDIQCIILTHRHLDHCLGLPYFLFGRNLERIAKVRQNPDYISTDLSIIAEKDIWESLWKLFNISHPDIPSLGFNIEFNEISSFKNNKKIIGEFELQSFEVDHSVSAFGLIFWQHNIKLLAYSTDTLPSDMFIQASSGVKVFIHEAMVPISEDVFSKKTKHSTTVQAGNAIAKVSPQKAFLIHLRPSFLNKQLILEKEASDAAGIQVNYPEEGFVLNIKDIK